MIDVSSRSVSLRVPATAEILAITRMKMGGRIMKYLVIAVMAAALLIPLMPAKDVDAICFVLDPYCDEINVNLSGNNLTGTDDNCGYCQPACLGGSIGAGYWTLFIDWQNDLTCSGYYEFAVIIGQGTNGMFYRYTDQCALGVGDPQPITLVPCILTSEESSGSPAGLIE